MKKSAAKEVSLIQITLESVSRKKKVGKFSMLLLLSSHERLVRGEKIVYILENGKTFLKVS